MAGYDASAVDRHVLGLDLLRFLAAASVMVFHLSFWVAAFPSGLSAIASRHLIGRPILGALTGSGWVGVEIFFVISGYVIAYSAEHETPRRFAAQRLIRLGPGVWICGAITAMVGVAAGVYTVKQAAFRYALGSVFDPFQPWVDSVYWTLGIEIVFYTAVAAMIAGRGRPPLAARPTHHRRGEQLLRFRRPDLFVPALAHPINRAA